LHTETKLKDFITGMSLWKLASRVTGFCTPIRGGNAETLCSNCTTYEEKKKKQKTAGVVRHQIWSVCVCVWLATVLVVLQSYVVNWT